MAALHITLAAEKIGAIGSLPVTNSLLTTWVVMGLLVAFSIAATRKMSMIPKGAQLVAEMVIGGLHDFFESVAGPHIRQFFPFIATLFLYILIANWVGLLPGVGTIGFFHKTSVQEAVVQTKPVENGTKIAIKDDSHAVAEPVADDATPVKPNEDGHATPAFVPLFRAATADLNMTIALAVISIVTMQYFGFKNLGFKYSGRFFNFKDPIMFGVGLLELVSDFSKILSFGFRLFGNIFAGEVLLAVIAYIMPYILPLPFLAMELFVGIIQALVFSMLSAAFFTMAVSHEDGHEQGKEVSTHG